MIENKGMADPAFTDIAAEIRRFAETAKDFN